MEISKELGDHEREEMASFNLPPIGAMQLAASTGFGHNIEIISHACHARPKNTDFDIEEGESGADVFRYGPLPVYLKFEDVEYKVLVGSKNPVRAVMSRVSTPMSGGEGKYKQILKGITGSVGPGEILALMGPSGSGKTTLLKAICGRFRDNVKGSLSYNDIPYSPALKRSILAEYWAERNRGEIDLDRIIYIKMIGFVTQDDVLFPQLTVEETLVFAALLRLPSNMSRHQKLARAEKILKELGLERCRHTRVGGGFVKGVSGGERKRTSIGYEILVDPSLLLLDEPTSGLDSTSANRLLQILQALAKAGRTVITTIHQPSSRMFYMFDKLLLISEGYPIYYGRARESLEYFASLRFVPELAMNPAEFLLDLAAGHMNNISIPDDLKFGQEAKNQEKNSIKYLHAKYKEIIEPKEKEENHKCKSAPAHLQIAVQVKKDWTMSWWHQFFVLWKRTYRERCTDYFDKLRIVQAIGVALLLGLLWWKSKIGTEAELRDQVGLMFYICIFWTTSSIFGAVYVFPFESMYLTKDMKADMYRLSVYYACSSLCDMMAHVLYPTVFMSILYFMADFKRTVPCFFLTLFAIFLIVITSQGVGELFGAAVMSIKRSGMMASLVLMLFLLTGGYYVQHIPVFMHWLKYISFVYYGFRLLLKVQYSGDEAFECESASGCRSLQTSPTFSTVDLKGGVAEVWILMAMALSFRLCAYACLRKRITASNF